MLGDWREGVSLWDSVTSSDVLLFSMVIPTGDKVTTLMHDHIYRMAVAWQNTAYNQPPHLGYYLRDYNTMRASFNNLEDSGALNQIIEVGESIQPIMYSWKNAEDVIVQGLPKGITVSTNKDAFTFTIEGAGSDVGTYNYTISSVGNEEVASLSGTITIIEAVILNETAYYAFDETSGNTAYNAVLWRSNRNQLSTYMGGRDKRKCHRTACYAKQSLYDAIVVLTICYG